MGRGKLRSAIGHVKDRTSISLAKVGSSASLVDLEVAIVKATRHDEHPADERHIREILTLTTYCRSFVCVAVNSIARRLNKTKNWRVALKTLMLVQRLLSEGDQSYQQEFFLATRRGTRLLNLGDFRDCSQSNSHDYSSLVRTYALYLDDVLEFRMLGRQKKNVAWKEEALSRMQRLLQLLERFLACQPTGAARCNRIVRVALFPVVKESFQIYYEMTQVMGMLIDRFMELDVPECFKVYDMFSRSTQQFGELDAFYIWAKNCGIARLSEYPVVERIPNDKLIIMVDCIRERTSETARIDASDEPEEGETEHDDVKALPAPEFVNVSKNEARVEREPEVEPKEESKQETGDLLHLGDDVMSSEDHSNQLALALFQTGAALSDPQWMTSLTFTSTDTGTPLAEPQWTTFTSSSDDDSTDWETALVQSASNLSNQSSTLGGGFDPLLLGSMYQQEETMAAMRSIEAGRSASSMALGSAGRPAVLSLPAPPTAAAGVVDPFAASVQIQPPSYVQMSDLEKKQHLLAEEQRLWQQYARDGMQGQALLEKLQWFPSSTPRPHRYG